MFETKYIVTSATELREMVPPARLAQQTKVLSQLDGHCSRWIERSPLVVVASADSLGSVDLSPKGDPPGFVRVLDSKTLAIPDRPAIAVSTRF